MPDCRCSAPVAGLTGKPQLAFDWVKWKTFFTRGVTKLSHSDSASLQICIEHLTCPYVMKGIIYHLWLSSGDLMSSPWFSTCWQGFLCTWKYEAGFLFSISICHLCWKMYALVVLVHITHPVTVINKYLQKILGSDLPNICLSFTNICKMLRKQFDNEKCCWVQCPRLALTCFTSARCPGNCWMLLLHVAVHADCVSPTWLECFILLYECSIQKTLCENLLSP